MKEEQADRLILSILDRAETAEQVSQLSAVPLDFIQENWEDIGRLAEAARLHFRFVPEDVTNITFPPPPNPYLDKSAAMDAQCNEYMAYEALGRGTMDLERAIWICGQLGIEKDAAAIAIENVLMPWREANGWRSYARSSIDMKGKINIALQTRPPVKLAARIRKWKQQLLDL